MKNLAFTFFAMFMSCMAFSQSLPFKYQAVIHDNDGKVLPNKTIGLRVSILQDTNAIVVYREEFTNTSDEFGIIDLEIGTGSPLSGNYLTINWSKQLNQLKVEIDLNGGTTYSLLGTTPILSAPIANYAYKAGSSTFPPGMIMPFAGPVDKVPEGWLLCNGSEVSRTDMAGLFEVIGVAYGVGNQTSTFNLPDLRGMFLRGANLGRTDSYKDPDVNSRVANGFGNKDEVGSLQVNINKSHNHVIQPTTGTHEHSNIQQNNNNIRWGDNNGVSQNYTESASGAGSVGGNYLKASTTGSGHAHPVDADGGSESRPSNIYVNYIIKF